ncbi:NAD(+) diphosphatase [Clostridium sp. P21]|uniref:NAD(+) diphosphatase n=1 Tax=Clostridium muellerianum TaxID=2716538 RepID=A0A7Y0HNN0_9CLOT|nr:NAD(+) diphosphatase [Clostridium muellerianum]NMM61788.1 NAD(+) diphosphatase [Clostridium muellerianum]
MKRESIYKRYSPKFKQTKENDNNTYWFIFNSDKLLVKMTDNVANILTSESIEELKVPFISTNYMGTLNGHNCFAAITNVDEVKLSGMCFKSLRSLYDYLAEDIFLLAGKALQIAKWEETHKFCGRCGSATNTVEGEYAKVCPKCGFTSYPRISPAVITAVIKDGQILLAHNKSFPGNVHSIIAGFVEPGETLEECVRREIFEEVGIKVKNIEYFSSQPWPFPNSLMVGFVAEYESGEISVDGEEITKAEWFKDLSTIELPSKMSIAREIIEWYREKYCSK